jgi:predicted nucleic acid-binding Zn ribbon protein
VVGAMVAKHTTRLSIRNKILYVKLDSAALRNELMFAREKIVKALNKEAGTNMLTEIVFN